jgi:hypothetical protein
MGIDVFILNNESARKRARISARAPDLNLDGLKLVIFVYLIADNAKYGMFATISRNIVSRC